MCHAGNAYGYEENSMTEVAFLTQSAQSLDITQGHFMTVFNVILLIYGAYSVYAANKMQKTGEPMQWLLSNEELLRARKPNAFCNYMSPKTRIFGILCILYGFFGIITDFWLHLGKLEMIVLAAFVIAIVWFFITLKKAKKKYV